MAEVPITETRTTEVKGVRRTNMVTFRAQEIEAPQVGPTSVTGHKPLAFDHVEKSKAFFKIQSAVVVFVEKFEKVRWHVSVVAFFGEELQELLDAHSPVSVNVY